MTAQEHWWDVYEDEDHAQQQQADPGPLGSWQPVTGDDLFADTLAGEAPPTALRRSDGTCAFYRGAVNGLHGETETGKSWVAQAACAEALADGSTAVYVDFESTRPKVVERLVTLGAPTDAVTSRFYYVRPTDPVDVTSERLEIWGALLTQIQPGIGVVDGVTDAMTVHGLEIRSNEDYSKFTRIILRPLADNGAATISIDHVTKSSDGRGRFAIGAQHKLAAIDGVAYEVSLVKPFVRGQGGANRLTVSKDRPGYVRERCPDTNRRYFGDFTLTPDLTTRGLNWTLALPTAGAWRPTIIMGRIVEYLGRCPDKASTKNRIEDDVEGRASTIREAIGRLEQEGAVVVTPHGTGKATTVTLVRDWSDST